jgi:glycosyltransferase involved in cell wall biosynthesis
MLHGGAAAQGRQDGTFPARGEEPRLHDARGEEPTLRYGAALPHVCFVAPFAWPVFSGDRKIKLVGGAEVQQSILMRLLQRKGYRVSLVCLDFGQPQGIVVDGITVYKTYRYDAGIPLLRFLHPRLTSVWQALHAANADIYYQRSAGMLTAVVAEFCRRHGKRSVYAGASDMDFQRGKQQIRYARDRWLYDWGLARVDRVVVQNTAQLEACRAGYGREATLIRSCYRLPEDRTADTPARGDAVLWVGTVHDYKRPELLLELARRLPHRRFMMIGGSAAPGGLLRSGYYEGIRDAAARLPNVEFAGFLPLQEVEKHFDGGRVLLNTSSYEGMPNTFLQAWARGIPTVATVDVGARIDGKELYKTFTGVEDGAAEIERLFADKLHWARASARCLEYFNREHSSDEVLRRYSRLFDQPTARSGK